MRYLIVDNTNIKIGTPKWQLLHPSPTGGGTGYRSYTMVTRPNRPAEEKLAGQLGPDHIKFSTTDRVKADDEMKRLLSAAHDEWSSATQQLTGEALTYLQNTLSGSPQFADVFTVVAINRTGSQRGTTAQGLSLALSDGTDIHIKVFRNHRGNKPAAEG